MLAVFLVAPKGLFLFSPLLLKKYGLEKTAIPAAKLLLLTSTSVLFYKLLKKEDKRVRVVMTLVLGLTSSKLTLIAFPYVRRFIF